MDRREDAGVSDVLCARNTHWRQPQPAFFPAGFLKITSCIHAWIALITRMRQVSKDAILIFHFH